LQENFKWPKDGLVMVLCEHGKYWAATVDPHSLKEIDNKSSEQIFEMYFKPALEHLKNMASDARKEAIKQICKKQVNGKFSATN